MNSLVYHLRQIKGLLSKQKIDYAIIGGIAASLYSEPRLTLDVDVNIMLDSHKMDAFLREAKKYGFSPIPSNIKKFVRRTGVLPMRFSKNKIEGRCDFIIAQNALEYSTIKRARSKRLYSISMKIASPEDMIIHKITSERPRDLEDARGILMKQHKKLDIAYITRWIKIIAESNRKRELVPALKDLLKIKI